MFNVNKDDKDYMTLVSDILGHETFKQTAAIFQHGTNTFTHSLKVSYSSYKATRFLKLDYKAAAVAGLLHDFYDRPKIFNLFEAVKIQLEHSKIASDNARKLFFVTDKERDIIETHMFPLTKPSRHLEGWIVSLIDKSVSFCEYISYVVTQFAKMILSIFKTKR